MKSSLDWKTGIIIVLQANKKIQKKLAKWWVKITYDSIVIYVVDQIFESD